MVAGSKRGRRNLPNEEELQRQAIVDESLPSESLQVVPIQSEPMVSGGAQNNKVGNGKEESPDLTANESLDFTSKKSKPSKQMSVRMRIEAIHNS